MQLNAIFALSFLFAFPLWALPLQVDQALAREQDIDPRNLVLTMSDSLQGRNFLNFAEHAAKGAAQ